MCIWTGHCSPDLCWRDARPSNALLPPLAVSTNELGHPSGDGLNQPFSRELLQAQCRGSYIATIAVLVTLIFLAARNPCNQSSISLCLNIYSLSALSMTATPPRTGVSLTAPRLLGGKIGDLDQLSRTKTSVGGALGGQTF